MRKLLSDRTLKSLKADPKRRAIFDTKLEGFHAIPSTSKDGQATFAIKYSVRGKQRKKTLGIYPYMTLKQARTKALAIRSEVSDGRDPVADEKSKNQEKFEDALDLYLDTYSKHNHRPRTQVEVRRFLNIARDEWGDRPIAQIVRKDVMALLDECARKRSPLQSNRLHGYLSGFLNWAADRDMIEVVPVRRGMKPLKTEPTRDRWLRDDELLAIWNAAELYGYPFGPLVKMLILTGQRRGEVTKMRWEEITGLEGDEPVWTIPSHRNKGKREHTLPLPSAARRVLRAIEDVGYSDEFVFVTYKADGTLTPMVTFSKTKKRLDEMSGVTDWRLHDLRRTLATGLGDLGFPPYLAGMIMNHSNPSVTAIYDRANREQEMRIALEAWATKIDGMIDPSRKSTNIVEMRA